jgi:hypothetical protein
MVVGQERADFRIALLRAGHDEGFRFAQPHSPAML